ncbi:hypothetical protein PIIN_11616 [Serendipita indica DSM 11827]|uniref:Uncharacterized protein n=1 Tax=Serendipita indica (strain DSM 11827) TaxID=1109443 RepID=G4U245_SERID|nr:hypothetical protein PIIN_11616 [Serendipita indica DSM 11827]
MGTQEVLTSWTQPHCRHRVHAERDGRRASQGSLYFARWSLTWAYQNLSDKLSESGIHARASREGCLGLSVSPITSAEGLPQL